MTTTVKIFKKDEKTYELDELAESARWSYYVSAYSMLGRTEGVQARSTSLPFLHRNFPSQLETDDEYNDDYSPASHEDGLVLRISPQNYHILYDPGTSDWFTHSVKQQKKGLGAYEQAKQGRIEGLKTVMENQDLNPWIKAAQPGEVEKTNEDFARWIQDGPPDVRMETDQAAAPVVVATDAIADEVMGGT